MPNAVQPAVSAGEIVFELERFERDGDRLTLSGRWFGVRGRRFVRPTLTPLGGNDRSRVLADLEHKPWPAEDGGSWEAAFPLPRGGQTVKFELSVSPDIAIQLPSPGSKRASRRLAALPRHRGALSSTSTGSPVWGAPADVEEAAPPRDPALERLEIELGVVKAKLQAADGEIEARRATLSAREHELEAAREELASAQADHKSASHATAESIAARDHVAAERDHLLAEREKLAAQRDQLKSHHDALARDREQVITERDQLMIERDQLMTDQDRLRAEREQLTAQVRQAAGEHERTRQGLAELQSRLDQATVALDAANRQRDEAVAARGAALVMRRAAWTGPHYERSESWWKTVLAVLALIGVVFAILIVAQVL
jgi:hypothetical protein